ncbi:translation elongation factor Ts [Buchnera aphidicola (Ceratovacuna keduensis)]|uniref:translation elongation factor Ts n=1 Tax=Buchnera aphidicola TaxID=9 RepID=UPI0031B85207
MKNISYSTIKKLRKITGIGILECKNEIINTKGNIEEAIFNLRKKGAIKAEEKKINKTYNGIILSHSKNNFGVILEIKCQTDFVSKGKYFKKFGKKILKYSIQNCCKDINEIKKKFEKDRIELLNKVNENILINKFYYISGETVYSYVHSDRIGVLISTYNKNNYKSLNIDKNVLKKISMHIVAKKPKYLKFEDIPKEIVKKEIIIHSELTKKLQKPTKYFNKIVKGKVRKFFSKIILMEQDFAIDEKKNVEQFTKENNIILKNFVRLEI